MNNDKTYQFVSKLFATYNYNGSQWDVDAQMDSYYNLLKSKEAETGKEYNYDKMYSLIEREYKFKTVPTKNLLIDWQKRCVKHNYDTSQDGKLAVFLCYMAEEDGHYKLKEIRDYVICNSESTKDSEKEILHKLKERYDEVVVKYYKEGSSLVNGVVFIPKTYDELGEVIECDKEKVA